MAAAQSSNGAPLAAATPATAIDPVLLAEAAVLSAVMIDPEAFDKVGELLRAEHFFSEAHRRIWESCAGLGRKGVPIDNVSVATDLRDRDRLAQVGMPYLTEVLNAAPAVANVVSYAEIVRKNWADRQLLYSLRRRTAELEAGAGAPDVLASLTRDIATWTPPSASASAESPTAVEPLRGLSHLGRVAVVGRAALVALSECAISYAWAPVARPGWIVMLAGGVGSGKTSLLFLLVAARLHLGAPVPVLGRLVQPAPPDQWIVLVEGEVDDIATAKKLRKSMAMLGVDDAALERVIVIARKGVVVGDAAWEDIERLIGLNLVSDVVLDTLARATRADSNDEQEQAAVFERVSSSVQSASPDQRPIVWVVAHTRKGDGIDLDDIAGSAQRVAQMDSVLMLRAARMPSGKVISSTVHFRKLRHDPDEYPEPVSLVLDTDPSSGRPRCRVDAIATDKDQRPLETRIVELLERDGPLTRKRIVETLKRNPVDVQDALDTLFAEKRLVGARVKTKNGQQYAGIDVRRGGAGGTGTPSVREAE